MLPKKNCLKRKKDFERVFKEGKGLKEGFLFLKHASNRLEASRFGVVVSQKVSKKAVVRNKVKRRIRAIVAQKLQEMGEGKDFVFVALPGLENRDFQELEEMINKLLKKAGERWSKK